MVYVAEGLELIYNLLNKNYFPGIYIYDVDEFTVIHWNSYIFKF